MTRLQKLRQECARLQRRIKRARATLIEAVNDDADFEERLCSLPYVDGPDTEQPAEEEAEEFLYKHLLKPLYKVYSIQRKIYGMASGDSLVMDTNVNMFRKLLEVDGPAVAKKRSDADKLPDEEDKWRIRVELRDLVLQHWVLVNWASTEPFPKEILDLIAELEAELRRMTWLFRIFISYSTQDESEVQEFVNLAALLPETKHLSFWKYTHENRGGDEYKEKAKRAIRRSAMCLIFVSPDFMRSADTTAGVLRAIAEFELPHMLEERQRNGKLIFPILLRDLDESSDKPSWYAPLHREPSDVSVEGRCRRYRKQMDACAKDSGGRDNDSGPYDEAKRKYENEKRRVFVELARKVADRMRELSDAEGYIRITNDQKLLPTGR